MTAANARIPHVVVTGATSGIGRATVEALAARGARVIGIGRDPDRCREAESTISSGYPQLDVDVTYLVADLSSTHEVQRVAAEVRDLATASVGSLDAVVNNAGVVSSWRTVTAQGYEQQFAVNHLAAFVLSLELLPQLAAGTPGRVVVVSSGSHRGGRINWADPMFTRGYSMMRAYRQSKLANVLFCAEFNRRLEAQTGVRAWAVDPGLVRTDIGLKSAGALERFVWNLRTRSARAVEPEVPGVALASIASGDELVEPDHLYRRRDRPDRPDPAGLDPVAGERLWALSERLTGTTAPAPGPGSSR